MADPMVSTDGRTVTVRVPISIRRRGGRKLVVAPDGNTNSWEASRRRADNAMVKAVARAFRGREMLENGAYATIAEIALAEKINESYVGRILRLTLLAPILVEQILNRRQSENISLDLIVRPFPIAWNEQIRKLQGFK